MMVSNAAPCIVIWCSCSDVSSSHSALLPLASHCHAINDPELKTPTLAHSGRTPVHAMPATMLIACMPMSAFNSTLTDSLLHVLQAIMSQACHST